MIYFIAAHEVQRVKIGYSKHPQFRMEKMQAHSGAILTMLGSVEGDASVERQLHELLFADHSHNEWFHLSVKVEDVITALLAGTFDMATMPANARKAWVIEKHLAKALRSPRPTPDTAPKAA